jgi:hypothetical protein
VIFIYDPDTLPEGTVENNLSISFYNTSMGEWTKLGNIVVDPVAHIVSGDLSHFTAFALTGLFEIISYTKYRGRMK